MDLGALRLIVWNLFPWALAFVLLGCDGAQLSNRDSMSAGAVGRPHLEAEPPALDLGTVGSLAAIPTTLSLRNAGNATAMVLGTRTGCRCVVAELADKELGAGEEVGLSISIDPAGYHGIVRLKLAIFWNSPEGAPLVVPIRMRVQDTLSVSLPAIDFETGLGTQPEPKTLRIRSLHDEPFAITRVQAPDYLASTVGAYDSSTGLCEVQFALAENSQLAVDEHKERIRIRTTDSRQEWLDLPSVVNIREVLTARPSSVYLHSVAPGTSQTFVVRVSRFDGAPFRISAVQTRTGAFRVRYKRGSSRHHALLCSVAPEHAGSVNDQLEVVGDRERREVVRVPIGYYADNR